MSRDTRRVQTAVLRHPGSDEPVIMPTDRWDALALRAALADRSLWCGDLLGGCGRQLTTRIGTERVPHFSHYPLTDRSAVPCRRTSTDASSADHLFIHSAIKDLLSRHGSRKTQVTFEGEFATGGTCHWITVNLPDGQGVIVVALRGADLSEMEGRKERLLESSPWVSWLFGPGLRAPKRLLERDGFAMHLLFDDTRMGQPLQLGTQRSKAHTDWIDFRNAGLGETGLVTPSSVRATPARRRPSTEPAPAVPAEPDSHAPAIPVSPEDEATAPTPPPSDAREEPTTSKHQDNRTVQLHNGLEIPLPELRVLLGSIAQRYGFAEQAAKARLVVEQARSLRSDTVTRIELPPWLRRDVDAALGVQSRPDDSELPLLDPGPTVDQLQLPDAVAGLLRDLGWDPAADALRTRWAKVACTHRSYLYEHSEIGIETGVLGILQEIGKRWLTLAILDTFTLENRAKSAGEQSQVLASLRTTLFDLLGSESVLTGHLLLGHGEELAMQDKEYRSRSKVNIDGVLQLCGAMALLDGIDSVYELVRRWYPTVKDTNRGRIAGSGATDWKTALQEMKLGVVYDTVASGPDHDKQFTTTVRDRRGRTSLGTGRSKKAAEMAAAGKFVRMHAPGHAAHVITTAPTSFQYQAQVRPNPFPRERFRAQWRAIDAARALFALPDSAAPYLTQALMHSSWVYENQDAVARANQRDNTVLAHHGSVVVDALSAHRRATNVLTSTLSPTADDARIMTPTENAWREAFSSTTMASGLFLGKGEQSDPTRSYANAMQAVLAVAWRFNGQNLLRVIPPELLAHVDSASDGSHDHYTRLAESCAPFDVALGERYVVTGPDHQRSFTCTIDLVSGMGRISVTGQPSTSKGLSKQMAAKKIMQIIATTSSCEDWNLAADDLPLARFLLSSQMTQFPQVKRTHLVRLLNRGALGTTYLFTQDIEAFAAWAQQVEELTGGISGDDAEQLRHFYIRCRAEGMTESRKPLREALNRIARHARDARLSDEDIDSLDSARRVMRAVLDFGDQESSAVAETLQWIVVATDRRGGRTRVHHTTDGFAVTVRDADAETVLEQFTPLLQAQFPAITVEILDQTIEVGVAPQSVAQSILQAGALALTDSAMKFGNRLHETVSLLHEAVASGDSDAIEYVAEELTREVAS